MSFNYDIYISYANTDYQTEDNWIANFSHFLQRTLTQILNENVRFLHFANHEKPAEDTLLATKIMIAVVTPAYVLSADAVEEISNFYNNQLQNTGSQLFKIQKEHVKVEDEPTQLRGMLAYDFDEVTQETPEYWSLMIDLAYDIADFLTKKQGETIENTFKSKCIYLSESSLDLIIERNIIRRELRNMGYTVLPNTAFPHNQKELEINIKNELNQSILAIHLFGNDFGEELEGSEDSVMSLQNRFSNEKSMFIASGAESNNKNFSRILWLAPNLIYQSEKQKIFVDNLRQNADNLEGAELLEVPLEDLKVAVRRILTEKNTVVPQVNANAQKSIYLIYDKADEGKIDQITAYCKNANLEILRPIFEGNLLDIRKNHINNLVHGDIALIFSHDTTPEWTKMKLLDLLKSHGFGRKKEWKSRFLLTETLPILPNNKLISNVQILENDFGLEAKLQGIF